MPTVGFQHLESLQPSRRTGGHSLALPSGPNSWQLGASPAPQQQHTIRRRMAWWSGSIVASRKLSWLSVIKQVPSGTGDFLLSFWQSGQPSSQTLVQRQRTWFSVRVLQFLAHSFPQHLRQKRTFRIKATQSWPTFGWKWSASSQHSRQPIESLESKSLQNSGQPLTCSFDAEVLRALSAPLIQGHFEWWNASPHSSRSPFLAEESSRWRLLD